ncbi:hypothetical protein [Streptomyces fulvoviolaceus]|uniref:hypothetical protein n=1 Tax=Streptomyces fulvoviolaceus TaxID=285535 RepID=UPI000694F30A|nr:hypothetical protein [Streptomyces fulvoviolaceus]MCT9076273.1 hypothetical protein [Streptomyces fulvoviolaceus]
MTGEDGRRRGRRDGDRDGHGMGEHHSGGGTSDRRHVRPENTVAGRDETLEALLAAAMRGDGLDSGAEQRAVAAFRAARDAGAHRARTRRRDDWRPREQRRTARSLKATLSVFVASLTLGGVAFAAIGSTGPAKDDAGDQGGRPGSASAPDRPGEEPSASPAASAPKDRPATAKDTEAHCRAYEQKAAKGSGALDATAWQRLVAAAGGEAKVSAYCAGQLGRPAATGSKPDKTAKPAGGDTGNSSDNGKDKAVEADKAQEKKQ